MAESAEQGPNKNGGGKLKLIVVVVVVLAVLGGGGAFFLLSSSGGDEAAEVTTTTEPVEGAVIEADTMTVNLADGDVTRYARVTFGVVLPEGVDSGEVGERMPILKDAALSVIAGFESAELLTAGGLDRLRAQLTERAREVYTGGEVLRVVLTEVLVQ